MAKEILTNTYCDPCNADGDRTATEGRVVTLVFNGKAVSLDVCEDHGDSVEEYLHSLTEMGTAVTAAPARTRSASTSGSGGKNEDAAAIRKWAQENGHTVSERGRISQAVKTLYYRAVRGEAAPVEEGSEGAPEAPEGAAEAGQEQEGAA